MGETSRAGRWPRWVAARRARPAASQEADPTSPQQKEPQAHGRSPWRAPRASADKQIQHRPTKLLVFDQHPADETMVFDQHPADETMIFDRPRGRLVPGGFRWPPADPAGPSGRLAPGALRRPPAGRLVPGGFRWPLADPARRLIRPLAPTQTQHPFARQPPRSTARSGPEPEPTTRSFPAVAGHRSRSEIGS